MSGRVTRAGEARAEAVRERVAALLGEVLPGAQVRVEGERVVAEGRGLRGAAVRVAALRWVAGALK
ncbi:hypothetical protein [Sphingomonas sp. IW22]|uniref:hypothetical protein n=1 Tax=Sphingomonas sp. IW22 TaxID=3242489 RepID=UPI003521F5E3